jgi:hypothetical protein
MTRRELHNRIEAQALRLAEERRALRMAGSSKPWWFESESEPAPITEDHDGGPQMLAFTFVYIAVVVSLLVLGGWAWDRSDRTQRQAYCQQLIAASAASMPDYCNGGR